MTIDFLSPADEDNVYLSGFFQGNISLHEQDLESRGLTDIFFGKMNASGHFEWALSGGSEYLDGPDACTSDDEGNLYLAGNFWYELMLEDTLLAVQHGSRGNFLASYTPEGDMRWIREISGAGLDRITAMDYNDHLVISGFFSENLYLLDTVLYSPTDRAIFVAAVNRDGELIWAHSKSVQGSLQGTWEPREMAVNDDGRYFIAGSFRGNGIFGSDTIQTNTVDSDVFLVCGKQGEFLWGRKAGGVHEDELATLILHKDRLWLAGSFLGVLTLEPGLSVSSDGFFMDGFLMEYSLDGQPLNVIKIGQTGNQFIEAGSIGENIFLTAYADTGFEYDGVTFPYNSNDRQHYFMLLDQDLELINWFTVEGSSYQWFEGSLIIGESIYFAGHFEGTLITPEGAYDSGEGWDGLVVKLDISNKVGDIPDSSLPLTLMPNPAASTFQCKFHGETLSMQVFDPMGRFIYSGKTNRTVDCSTWPSGIYTVHVFGEKKYITLPLTIQR